jgi:hypothetical protein
MTETNAMSPDEARHAIEGCTLDDRELAERLRAIARLLAQAMIDCHRNADGIVLSFHGSAAAAVRDVVRRERECCGFLDFTLEETDDQRIRLVVRSRPQERQEPSAPSTQAVGCGCPMCCAA